MIFVITLLLDRSLSVVWLRYSRRGAEETPEPFTGEQGRAGTTSKGNRDRLDLILGPYIYYVTRGKLVRHLLNLRFFICKTGVSAVSTS